MHDDEESDANGGSVMGLELNENTLGGRTIQRKDKKKSLRRNISDVSGTDRKAPAMCSQLTTMLESIK